jgi:hypothetical protein
MFFRSKKSLFAFAPEGYLSPSGWAPELDKKKSGGDSLQSEPFSLSIEIKKKKLSTGFNRYSFFLFVGEHFIRNSERKKHIYFI